MADLDAETIGGILRVADAFAEVGEAADPEGPDAPWQDGGDALRRGVHAHEAVFRDRRQAAVGGRDEPERRRRRRSRRASRFRDTALTLEAMGVDAIVVRHPCAGAPHQVAQIRRRQR